MHINIIIFSFYIYIVDKLYLGFSFYGNYLNTCYVHICWTKKKLKRAIKEKKYLCGEIIMNELITLRNSFIHRIIYLHTLALMCMICIKMNFLLNTELIEVLKVKLLFT